MVIFIWDGGVYSRRTSWRTHDIWLGTASGNWEQNLELVSYIRHTVMSARATDALTGDMLG